MSKEYNIHVDRGGTFKITVNATDANNVNILTSATGANAQIRLTPQSETSVADFNCSFTANNASLVLSLSANQTSQFVQNNMSWDCKVTFADGTQTFLLGGKVILRQTVTR